MKRFAFFILLVSLASIFSCKRDKDVVTTHTISGQVFNLCNDSGLANVTVHFNINDPSGGSSVRTTTDSKGNFTFSNVQIHSSGNYNYDVSVLGNGAGGYQPAINGDDFTIDKNNIGRSVKLNVVPMFKSWNIYLPHGTPHIYPPDTFTLIMQQKIVNQNTSQVVSQVVWYPRDFYLGLSNGYYGFGDYPMGWWHITLDKTKSGVHSVIKDSIYLGWAGTVTDTLPW